MAVVTLKTCPKLRRLSKSGRCPSRSSPWPHHRVAESRVYRLKNRLLGPPLHTEELANERLGKPTALAVFASDNLSSVAYGTEEILIHLVPFVGVAAFAMLMPITVALLVVLGFLILSYRQTIKAYPLPAARTWSRATTSGCCRRRWRAWRCSPTTCSPSRCRLPPGPPRCHQRSPLCRAARVPISIAFIGVIAYGNLRGVKESGRLFAVPTYFFIVTMVVMLIVGIGRMLFGHLPVESLNHHGLVPIGHRSSGFLAGASLFVVLRAFASGGAAVTGVEAISNGVPAFRVPEWKNARTTLVIMGSTLGVMFFGLSLLAARMHVAPYEKGTPTVISQIGKIIFGRGAAGTALYFCLQAGTMLILVLAANTSFPTSRGWRRSTPATTSCRNSSPSAATASCSPTGSSSSPPRPPC